MTPAASLSHDAALTRLLDDPSPAVRRALLAHFSTRPADALRLLSALAQNPKSPLAPIAQSYLDELELSDPAEDFRALIRARSYELETGALFLARVVQPDLKHAQINDVLEKPCPALVMTAETAPDVVGSIKAHGFPLLIKPVSPPSLRVVMHNLLFEPELMGEVP